MIGLVDKRAWLAKTVFSAVQNQLGRLPCDFPVKSGSEIYFINVVIRLLMCCGKLYCVPDLSDFCSWKCNFGARHVLYRCSNKSYWRFCAVICQRNMLSVRDVQVNSVLLQSGNNVLIQSGQVQFSAFDRKWARVALVFFPPLMSGVISACIIKWTFLWLSPFESPRRVWTKAKEWIFFFQM